MTNRSSDRNLLLGILALQFGLVTKDRLIDAMGVWANDKSQPLDEIFVRMGVIDEDGRAKLTALVKMHLELHGGAPDKSLAALSSVGSLRQELVGLHDPDVDASLVHVSFEPLASTEDPYRTIGGGQTTSEGVRFRILRPHAKGGLGEVSVALDSELNREVALKEIQSKFADISESRARFMLEAQITGGLEHPGIVPVYGMGTYADGRPFYAMRFIRGDSLKDGVRKFFAKFGKTGADVNAEETGKTVKLPVAAYESLDFRQLLGRFVDVCNAVAYAHARGVLHRDLKPGNIMLGNYGETLVVDWGLAKATGQADDSLDTTQAPLTASTESGSAETRLGSALGTPGYMSPEQAAGRTDLFGPATDIYCLGATLYHLLTGRPPHLDTTDGNLLQRIQSGEFPRPRDLNPAIPAPLAAICLKAMATEQKHRYPTALSLAADIERFLADDPVTAHRDSLLVRAQRWSRRHRTLVTAAAALLLTATVAITLSYFALSEEQSRTLIAKNRANQLSKENETLAANESYRNYQVMTDNGIRLLNDGQYQSALLYFVDALGRRPPNVDETVLRQRIQAISQRCPVPVGISRHGDYVLQMATSLDGRLLATASRDGGARVWDASTGRPLTKPLPHVGEVGRVAFSPDAQYLATAGSTDKLVKIWNLPSGALAGSLPQEFRVDQFWFTDSNHLVTRAPQQLRRWDVSKGSGENLCPLATGELLLNVSPDLRLAAIRKANTTRLIELGALREWAPELKHDGKFYRASEFSPFGRFFAIAETNSVVVIDCKTGHRIREQQFDKQAVKLLFSPDAHWLAIAAIGNQVYLIDCESLEHRVLEHPAQPDHLQFSGDSQFLATTCADAQVRLWRTKTGEERLPAIHVGTYAGPMAFSRQDHRLHTVAFDSVVTWDIDRLTNASEGPTELPSVPTKKAAGVGDAHLSMGRFAFPTGDSAVDLVDLDSERQFPSLTHDFPLAAAKLSPNGRFVATLTTNGQLRVWNGESARMIGPPAPLEAAEQLLAVSDEGTVIAKPSAPDGGATAALSIYAINQPRRAVALKFAANVGKAYFLDEQRLLTTASSGYNQKDDSRSPRVWDLRTGHPIAPPLDLNFFMSPLLISRNQDYFAVNSGLEARFGSLRDWKLSDLRLRHESLVTNIALSDNGRWLATVTEDSTLRIWNLDSGKPVGAARRLNFPHSLMLFSRDHRFLVTSDTGHSRVWEVATGHPLTPPLESSRVLGCRLLGERLVGVEFQQPAIRWWSHSFQPAKEPLGELRSHAETLALGQIDADGLRITWNPDEIAARIEQPSVSLQAQ